MLLISKLSIISPKLPLPVLGLKVYYIFTPMSRGFKRLFEKSKEG